MADVLISENIVGAPVEKLKQSHRISFQPDLWKKPDALLAAVADVRALIVRNQTKVSPALIAAAPRLEVIGRAGVGLDNVDVQAASEAGVVVAFTPSQNSISVAELAIGLMLGLARKIPAADQHVKLQRWERQQFMGSELYGKTLGVVGMGRIGRLTAQRAAAFGMELLAYDPFVTPQTIADADIAARLTSLDELLPAADVVCCHLPANESTRALFNYDRFCQMKATATFINVARGEVVDEEGLIRALREKKIAAAGLDVRSVEPPKPGALDAMENVILTPHIGAFTHEGQFRVVESICNDVASVLSGGDAADFVNFSRPRKPVG